jgi:hypothetical protein
MAPEPSGPRPRPSRYASFAARLKDAHAALRDPRIPASSHAELSKRVFAITAMARHDITAAAQRLEAFFAELSGLSATGFGAVPGNPPGKNTATQG